MLCWPRRTHQRMQWHQRMQVPWRHRRARARPGSTWSRCSVIRGSLGSLSGVGYGTTHSSHHTCPQHTRGILSGVRYCTPSAIMPCAATACSRRPQPKATAQHTNTHSSLAVPVSADLPPVCVCVCMCVCAIPSAHESSRTSSSHFFGGNGALTPFFRRSVQPSAGLRLRGVATQSGADLRGGYHHLMATPTQWLPPPNSSRCHALRCPHAPASTACTREYYDIKCVAHRCLVMHALRFPLLHLCLLEREVLLMSSCACPLPARQAREGREPRQDARGAREPSTEGVGRNLILMLLLVRHSVPELLRNLRRLRRRLLLRAPKTGI